MFDFYKDRLPVKWNYLIVFFYKEYLLKVTSVKNYLRLTQTDNKSRSPAISPLCYISIFSIFLILFFSEFRYLPPCIQMYFQCISSSQSIYNIFTKTNKFGFGFRIQDLSESIYSRTTHLQFFSKRKKYSDTCDVLKIKNIPETRFYSKIGLYVKTIKVS